MKAVNLLPPDMRGVPKPPPERSVVADGASGTGAYALLGGLGFAVAAVAGVVLAGNAVTDREAQLSSVKARQQQIAGKADTLKPFADFDEMAQARVATVRDLAGARFDWEQALRDLSRAIPGDVTLSEITGNVSTDTGGGGGSDLRSAIAAPAITVSGCTTGQTKVARLMARLRNVDGVTRVSLSKSEKADTSPNAAGAVAGTGTAADRLAAPCGQGAKPKFELVMFFENALAASTGLSAQAPAPGQPGAPGQPAAPSSGSSTSTSTQGGGTASNGQSASPQATPTTQGGATP
jgi:Tfp pilus assembly protein PilN